jgi:Fur family ferric uptake transcriptional regulator
VVELLSRQDCCLSAQEIAERLRAHGDRVGTASVYRALDRLQRTGLVQRVEVGDGGARYEAVIPGGEHHHHVVCDRCGRITPFEDRPLERAIERLGGRLGHSVSGHDVVIRGECPRCAGA